MDYVKIVKNKNEYYVLKNLAVGNTRIIKQ